MMIKLEENTLL